MKHRINSIRKSLIDLEGFPCRSNQNIVYFSITNGDYYYARIL